MVQEALADQDGDRDVCPRCRALLRQRYYDEEAKCPKCGYVDYDSPGEVTRKRHPVVLYVAYAGTLPSLRGVVVRVRIGRGGGVSKLSEVPCCPFCGEDIPDVRSRGRYSCRDGHWIQLVRDEGGNLVGWR